MINLENCEQEHDVIDPFSFATKLFETPTLRNPSETATPSFELPLISTSEVAPTSGAEPSSPLLRSPNLYLPVTGTLRPNGFTNQTLNSPEAQRLRADALSAAIQRAGPEGNLIIGVTAAGPGFLGGPSGTANFIAETENVLRQAGYDPNSRTGPGIEAWFEGMKAHPSTPFGQVIASSGAALGARDSSGSYIPDLTNPAVSQALVNMVEEVSANPAVDKLVFDDHFGIPKERLQEFYTAHADQLTGMDPIQQNQWLRDRMSGVFGQLMSVADRHGKDVVLSMNGTFETAEATGQDPIRWMGMGVDVLETQIYRQTPESFQNTLDAVERRISADADAFKGKEVRVAVGAVADGKIIPPDVRAAQLRSVEAFAQRMKALDINVTVSVFDTGKYFGDAANQTAGEGGRGPLVPQ